MSDKPKSPSFKRVAGSMGQVYKVAFSKHNYMESSNERVIKRGVAKARVLTTLGNILTAGLINIPWYLYAKHTIKNKDKKNLVSEKCSAIAHQSAVKYGMSFNYMKGRMMLELGFENNDILDHSWANINGWNNFAVGNGFDDIMNEIVGPRN